MSAEHNWVHVKVNATGTALPDEELLASVKGCFALCGVLPPMVYVSGYVRLEKRQEVETRTVLARVREEIWRQLVQDPDWRVFERNGFAPPEMIGALTSSE